MTVIMVTHDIKEAFALGTRLIALNHYRVDPQAPGRYRRDRHLRLRSDPRHGRAGARLPEAGRERQADQRRSHAMTPTQPTRRSRKAGRLAAAAARAPPSSRLQRARDARAGRRSRPKASCPTTAGGKRAAMGARHGPARRRQPHRQVDPDLRPRRAAPLRRHQHLPQGALCRERPRRRQIRRRRPRHPLRFRHDLPPRHALRAAGHPAHLGALHALQLRARRRPARADDAVRRRRRVHDPGAISRRASTRSAAASRMSSPRARCR